MITKTVLQILDKSIELANLLIKLKKEEKQFKGVPPIPDYKKGAKESIVLPNGEKITLSDRAKKVFEEANLKTYYSKEWSKKLNDFLKKNNVSQEIISGNSLKMPTQEEMYEMLTKSQPFAHLIENKIERKHIDVESNKDIHEVESLKFKCPSCQHSSKFIKYDLKKDYEAKCKNCYKTFTVYLHDGFSILLHEKKEIENKEPKVDIEEKDFELPLNYKFAIRRFGLFNEHCAKQHCIFEFRNYLKGMHPPYGTGIFSDWEITPFLDKTKYKTISDAIWSFIEYDHNKRSQY